ncbi:hypothetical protein T03_216, partial [Trichinella britovi]
MRSFLQKMKMKTPKLQSEEEYGSCVYMGVGKLPGACLCLHCRRSLFPIYIFIVCCFVVSMPSGKRETERKVNAP